MTEQLNYNIYKISSTIDQMVYIGSTRKTLTERWQQHCHDCYVRDIDRPLYNHMVKHGKTCFKIELIKSIICYDSKPARILEQIEIWKHGKENCFNMVRAYTHNSEKTRDNEKKKATRRDYYNRKKQDPEWMAKERERNRIRMQKKRALIKEQRQRLNGDGQ